MEKKISYLFRIHRLKEVLGLSPNQVRLLQRMALHKFRKVSIEDYAQDYTIDKAKLDGLLGRQKVL